MSPAEIAALATAAVGFLTATSQWFRLFGPRRNGRSAWIHYLEARLTLAEAALVDCLDRMSSPHRTRPDRWQPSAHRGGCPNRPSATQNDERTSS